MIIGFNLIYNFNSSRLKPNFSREKKLLHVFWNTLYIYVIICILYVIKLTQENWESESVH